MEFNKLVKRQLFPILQKYGFEIAKEDKNIPRFRSSFIEINIVFNEYEKLCYISIGKRGESLHELRNNAIRELLNSSLSIEHVTPETFVQNLSILFQKEEGAYMLEGNIDDFINFKISEDSNYTFEILKKQTLDSASKTWESEYYRFCKSVDKIGINKAPISYQLKYKIGRQKMN